MLNEKQSHDARAMACGQNLTALVTTSQKSGRRCGDPENSASIASSRFGNPSGNRHLRSRDRGLQFDTLPSDRVTRSQMLRSARLSCAGAWAMVKETMYVRNVLIGRSNGELSC